MGITSDSGNKKPQGPTFSPLRTKNGQEKTTTSSLTAMTSVLQPSSVIRTVFELIPSPSSTGRNVVVKSANGTTSYEGTTYVTTVSWVSGLLQPGSSGASIFSLAYRKPVLPRTRLNVFGILRNQPRNRHRRTSRASHYLCDPSRSRESTSRAGRSESLR